MSCDLARHPLFTPWKDPASGVVSYLLAADERRIAPIQQNFYFCTSSISPDERWLWFTAAFPPNPAKTLCVASLDPDAPVLRHFPQASATTALPMVCPDSSGVFFGCGPTIYHLSVAGELRPVAEVPESFLAGRELRRLATHLTLSADGRYLLLDGQIADHWFVATTDITRPCGAPEAFRLIKEFPNNHNHAQFAPATLGDPTVFVIAHDHTRMISSGTYFHHNLRMFLMDTGDSRYEALTTGRYNKHLVGPSHEWWSQDGRLCWVDYQFGAYEMDVRPLLVAGTAHPTPESDEALRPRPVRVWPEELCHAHCSCDRRLWVADESPYKWHQKPCEVRFLDRSTGRRGLIASALPEPVFSRRGYHIDPHPQFSPHDTFVVYTSTAIGGRPDVALVRTADLREIR